MNYSFYLHYGLGDSVFHILGLKTLIKKYGKDLNINFYVKDAHLKQLQEIIDSEKLSNMIELKSIESYYPYYLSYINAWINRNRQHIEAHHALARKKEDRIVFNKFYNEFFESLFNEIKLKKDFVFELDYNLSDIDIELPFNNDKKTLFVVNSVPMSEQLKYDDVVEKRLDDYLLELSKKYNLITTKKVDGIEYFPHSILEYSNIAKKCDYIVAINTGPTSLLLQDSILKKDIVIYIDKNNKYIFDQYSHIKNLSTIEQLITGNCL